MRSPLIDALLRGRAMNKHDTEARSQRLDVPVHVSDFVNEFKALSTLPGEAPRRGLVKALPLLSVEAEEGAIVANLDENQHEHRRRKTHAPVMPDCGVSLFASNQRTPERAPA